MGNSVSEKITLLNQITLQSLGEQDKLAIIKKFTEASINIVDADFGYAWWRSNEGDDYRLVYQSANMDYMPSPPRKRGGNYEARKTGQPVFVVNTEQEKYSKEFDVRPHMKSYAIIPIVFDGKFYGNIVLCYKTNKEFSELDKSLAEALGNALAQALTISRLYNNLKRFQKTLDNTLDSIFIFDPETLQLEYINEGAVLFSGQKQGNLIGQPLSNIITGLSERELRTKIIEIISNPKSKYSSFESTIVIAGRGKVPVEISLQHIIQPGQPDRFLAIMRDITERKQNEKVIRKMAYFDPLTGLPNRSLLNERLAETHRLATQNKGMYALFFIDLDRFKIINDIYGHQSGDVLLNQVAKRMQKALPSKATLARMGGDEFLVLLPRIASVAEAEKVGSDILGIFSVFFEITDHELYTNGSVGFAIFPENGEDPHTLMKHADLALHRAKDQGGGNVQQYHVDHPLFYTMQPKLQSQLRYAIKNNELQLDYQPIINAESRRVIGGEALVRWDHPEMGLLYPDAFIGQAEESGLILEIGQWVITEVCQQINKWEAEGRIPPPLSINVSPRELLRPSLVTSIKKALDEFRVAPSQIRLELTETFLMKNIDLSIGILEQLKALGLRISIDDFGTGYASLNYLRRLPIDAVKIDQTFISGIPNNLQDSALTSAIIAISHQLGLDVVAEGVENEDQLAFLRAAQCNYVQGNYLHKPLNPDEFRDLLMAS